MVQAHQIDFILINTNLKDKQLKMQQENQKSHNINKTYQSIAQIAAQIKQKKSYLIGICGIPGSGKSYYAQHLKGFLQNSIIIPMDGFHLYRKDLTQDGLRFRGAAFTFDLKKFKAKIEQIASKATYPIHFPSFDHAFKDPIQDTIIIQQQIRYVIVEGLYLFDESIELNCWDFKIWIETDIDIAVQRVAKRHFACGIQPTMELSIKRANQNDRKNSLYVQEHSNIADCHKINNN